MNADVKPGASALERTDHPAGSYSAESLLLFVLTAAALGALYAWVFRDLAIQWWEDPNYSHGFLVPVFSGYLLWMKRDEIRALPISGSWLGLPLLLLGLGELILGVFAAENFLMRSSFLVVLTGLVLFHLGTPVLRAAAFPLAYLLFMIPLPQIAFNAIAFPLQTLAAENATNTLELCGVPVLRDGNVIHLSRITLGVTEACSGIRSLVSLLALAAGWAYLSLRRGWSMAALVVSAVPITILANAARIVFTGLIGQWFGSEYAEGFFHGFSGWLIFVVAFVWLAGVQAVLAKLEGERRIEGAAP